MKKDKSNFLDWWNNFSLLYGGIFNKPDEWYDKVQQSHILFHKKYGKEPCITSEVELEKSDSEQLERQLIAPYYLELRELIPDYLNYYGLDNCSFQYPTVPLEQQQGMSWGKHINFWLNRHKDIPSSTLARINKLVSQLGILYAQHKTTKDKYLVTLSVDPSAFVTLGHLNVDCNSCFKHRACNEIHKYIIGQNNNTFVGYVSKEELYVDNIREKALMRFWGVFSEDFKRFDICNIYPRNPNNQGNIYRSISKAMGTFLECKKPREIPKKFRIENIFCNKESPISYIYPDLPVDQHNSLYSFQSDGLDQYRKCVRCSKSAEKFENIDFSQYCAQCATAPTRTCDISGRKSFVSLYPMTYMGREYAACETYIYDYGKIIGGRTYHVDDLEFDGENFNIKSQPKTVKSNKVLETTGV